MAAYNYEVLVSLRTSFTTKFLFKLVGSLSIDKVQLYYTIISG